MVLGGGSLTNPGQVATPAKELQTRAMRALAEPLDFIVSANPFDAVKIPLAPFCLPET
jgi:hypothetical protein